jgi:hypothetical protein
VAAAFVAWVFRDQEKMPLEISQSTATTAPKATVEPAKHEWQLGETPGYCY